jgi:hypothetical protein
VRVGVLLAEGLDIGYSRAAALLDTMEMNGYVGPFDGINNRREILLTRAQWEDRKERKPEAEKPQTSGVSMTCMICSISDRGNSVEWMKGPDHKPVPCCTNCYLGDNRAEAIAFLNGIGVAPQPEESENPPAPSTKHISDAALLAEIEAAEADVTEAERRWDEAKEVAKEKKEIFDGAVRTLRGIIRGKGELPLFDNLPAETEAGTPGAGPWQGEDDPRGNVTIAEALGKFGKKADQALADADVRTVRDLLKRQTEFAGLAIDGIGPATAEKITAKLEEFIMGFGTAEPDDVKSDEAESAAAEAEVENDPEGEADDKKTE